MSLRAKIWLGLFLVLFVSCSRGTETVTVTEYVDRLTTVTITEGDGQVTVSWEENVEPGSETSREGCSYNIYSAADPSLSIDNWAALSGGQKHENVTSPYTLTGLANGTTVYFLITMVCGGEETVLADLFSATPNQTSSAPGTTSSPSTTSLPDGDGDGIPDDYDNCPSTVNADQRDTDGDGSGDACDSDDDNDGVPDGSDNCQYSPNPAPTDTDSDGIGDACEGDVDGDGIPDDSFGVVCSGGAKSGCDDNCVNVPNAGQEDMDNSGVGDVCEPNPDSVPDAFAFTDVGQELRSASVTSNAITVAGINVTANVTTSSGTLVINGSDTGSSSGQVVLNDTVAVKVTSSASYNTMVDAAVTIGGVADTYSVTTYSTAVAELRDTNACVACDLSGAALSGEDLSGADLTSADLSGANLSGADLSGATLTSADLSGANLTNALFSFADLSSADLTGADLTNADLTNADLFDADLTGANLSSTNFSGAMFNNTTWINGIGGYTGTCADPSTLDTCVGVI